MPRAPREGFDRRDFLRLSAGLVAAGMTGACTDGGGSTATRTPDRSPSPSPSATATARPTGTPVATSSRTVRPQWSELEKRLTGPLLRPGDRAYERARLLFNPRFDAGRPQAVAQCASAADVQAVVRFATDTGLPLAVRAGGHSYTGASTGRGIVLDVTRMHGVRVAAGGRSAQVGPGARLAEVYTALSRRGLGVPGGSCPTVGYAGLTLGGGLGVLMRAWGLACDSVTAVDVVTADGRLRHADANHEAELFWACRGGGGGQLGVVTGFTVRPRPAVAVTLFTLTWPWARAADVLTAWQQWSLDVPDELWSAARALTVPGGRTPRVLVIGTWLGDPARLGAHLDRLAADAGRPAERSERPRPWLRAMYAEAGCGDLADCLEPRRTAFAASSNVLERPLDERGVAVVLDRVERRQAQRRPKEAGAAFDALGGAVARVAPTATAFPHRRARAVVQWTAVWPRDQSGATTRADLAWLAESRRALVPYAGGSGAYLNYADADLPDATRAYHGANLARLRRAKRTYDPQDLFRQPQSVRPG